MTEGMPVPRGGAAASDAPLASTVEEVTFFEDRAEVVRTASAVLPAGVAWVALAGLSAAADDASLVARATGARAVTARAFRRVRRVPAVGKDELAAIEAGARQARARRVAAERALERAGATERRIEHLLEAWLRGVGRVPRGGELEATRWRFAHDELARALRHACDDTGVTAGELQAARLDEARAQLRFEQARALTPRFEAQALVQLEVPAPGLVAIEVSYRTPLALWRPEHVARLVRDAVGQHAIEIATAAVVWQRTGEDWSGVRCRFSTARPAQAASPPLLADDILRLQRKVDKILHIEARDVVVASAGLGRGVRQSTEMPGVDDGGQPLVYEAARPVTVPSDGQPFRIDLDELRLPCTAELVVFPEVLPVAHHRATATLVGPRPLLAGPVRVARGASMVGRSRIAFVGQGEPFELGFGVDDGVRVRRRVDEKRDTGLTGTQKITRTVHLYLSNLAAEPRRLVVTERVPVSDLDEVQVKIVQAGGAAVDADGYARFTLELAGSATAELELVYRIEARGGVRLDF